jgi:hypothetical protein
MEALGLFFFLVAINREGGGIYLPFDHKHLHNFILFSCYLLFTAFELL